MFPYRQSEYSEEGQQTKDFHFASRAVDVAAERSRSFFLTYQGIL